MEGQDYFYLPSDYFGRQEIASIRDLPGGDGIVIIWLDLLKLACKYDGKLMLAPKVPFDIEKLSAVLQIKRSEIEMALVILSNKSMLDVDEDNVLYIKHWNMYAKGVDEDGKKNV